MGGKSTMDKVASRVYGLDEHGYEHPDPTPVEMPSRLRVPGNHVARIRALIAQEMSERAAAEGLESFEESDDFDLEDEEWVSPYEEVFEPDVVVSGGGNVPAVRKGNEDVSANRKDVADGGGKASGSMGAGSRDKGAGKAGGKAVGVAGSSGGAGGASEGSEGDQVEGESR